MGILHDLVAQHCTRLGMAYAEPFRSIKLDFAAQSLIDSLMIDFYKRLPAKFERDDNVLKQLDDRVYKHFPDSIKSGISFNTLNFNLHAFRDFYTLSSNGNSVAYNTQVDDFIHRYHLEGMSEEGLEIFVYQYPNHLTSLFHLENDFAKPVSPVVLKQMVIDEYREHLSSRDLQILVNGWDIKIQEFTKQEKMRDSLYRISLDMIRSKIDSLKKIYLTELADSSITLMNLLNVEEKSKWMDISKDYVQVIKEGKQKTEKDLKEYNYEIAPSILSYYNYFYELKLLFPSSNFWKWRKGPKLDIPAEILKTPNQFLLAYSQFEETMVNIIDRYSARIGFPNYYFSGSRSLSDDEKKRIQLTNALLFAILQEK